MANVIYLSIIAVLLAVLYVTYHEEKRLRPKKFYRVEEYWKGSDRREFQRISKALQIDYSYLSSDGKEFHKKDGKGKALSANVSWGGIQLLLPEKIAKGNHLSLEVQLEEERSPVRVIGEVVWSEEASNEPQPDGSRVFRTGVRFVGFSTEAQDRLIKFLYESGPGTNAVVH